MFINNQKGNITLVALLMVIGLMVVIVLSQMLLSNKISEKMTVDSSLQYSYSVDSSMEFVKHSIIKALEEKTINWELGLNGDDIFINIDFYMPLVDETDMLKVNNEIVDLSTTYVENSSVYLSDLAPVRIGEYCSDVNGQMVCDSSFDIEFNVLVQQSTKYFRFKVKVTDIGIDVYQDQMRINFNADNIKINFEEAESP